MFLVGRHRQELSSGRAGNEAIVEAVHAAGESVVFSGATVIVGFLALFLVRAPFLHAIALGGVLVVATAVLASLTLLPVLLSWLGRALAWPRRATAPSAKPGPSLWDAGRTRSCGDRGGRSVSGSRRSRSSSFPSRDSRDGTSARRTYRSSWRRGAAGTSWSRTSIEAGWVRSCCSSSRSRESVWAPESRRAIRAVSDRLARDPRIAKVQGFSAVLARSSSAASRPIPKRCRWISRA
jgi:hypothetical protein